jgi:NAD+ diphosphatase
MSADRTQAPPTIAFAGAGVDRADHLRADGQADELRRHPGSRAVLVGRDQQVALTATGALAQVPTSELPSGARLTFLELDRSGAAAFAADFLDLRMPSGHTFTNLREVMAELDPVDAALAAYAVGMVGWHRVHRHCGRCGQGTEVEQAGHRRRCANCGLLQFPRTDPAVTMLVQNGDSCLLSRRQGAPAHRWSALAGFVEPGETLEAAVVREAREETGVDVVGVEYVVSQPWPFPSALMIGFWAFVDPRASTELTPAPGELVEARWFDRAALARGLGDGSLALPPRGTIGNYLISTWLARTGR